MRTLLVGSTLLTAAALSAQVPHMSTVEPKNVKPGTVLNITGLYLKGVEEVYLTDHKFDLKVKVVEQNDKSMSVRVPPFAKPGRMQLLVLYGGGKEPKLLEQPVYVFVEPPVEEVGQLKTPEPVKTPEPEAPRKNEPR